MVSALRQPSFRKFHIQAENQQPGIVLFHFELQILWLRIQQQRMHQKYQHIKKGKLKIAPLNILLDSFLAKSLGTLAFVEVRYKTIIMPPSPKNDSYSFLVVGGHVHITSNHSISLPWWHNFFFFSKIQPSSDPHPIGEGDLSCPSLKILFSFNCNTTQEQP